MSIIGKITVHEGGTIARRAKRHGEKEETEGAGIKQMMCQGRTNIVDTRSDVDKSKGKCDTKWGCVQMRIGE